MAFVVEDGTGKPDANSYLDVAEADNYFTDRLNATSPDGNQWSNASTEDKQGALVEATHYLDATYTWVWGNPPWEFNRYRHLTRETLNMYSPLQNSDQALEWPRISAYDLETYRLLDSVPQKVKNATAELALIALDGALLPTQGRRIKRERVGQLEVEYQDNASAREQSFPIIDRMLRGTYWSSADGNARKLTRV
jgi:hypothetical protein